MRDKQQQLQIYEELMLLALRDEQGTFTSEYIENLAAAAITAELLLENRIALEEPKKKKVKVLDTTPTGDPIIDDCLNQIQKSKKQRSLQDWVSKLARIKEFRHKIARQLCDRGILRAAEDKILFLFTRRIYPEIDPWPEKQVVERLREAIFTDQQDIDPRTVVLISLAKSGDLLRQTFGKKEIKAHRQRIDQIIAGELTGKAAAEVIEAYEAAILVAVILPTIITPATFNN